MSTVRISSPAPGSPFQYSSLPLSPWSPMPAWASDNDENCSGAINVNIYSSKKRKREDVFSSHKKKKAKANETPRRKVRRKLRPFGFQRTNTVHVMLNRQLKTSKGRHFSRQRYAFSNPFKLAASLDTEKNEDSSRFELAYLSHRSSIVEIVAAKGIIFALTETGVCVAFDQKSCKRLCYLNIYPEEVIRSLFYNKVNNSIITVSVRGDGLSSLKCRSVPMKCVLSNEPRKGVEILASESLYWPGFVEFDDVNSKILTFSAKNNVYKIWSLKDYKFMYEMENKDVQEVKISPGIMLVVHAMREGEVEATGIPLKVLNIETGKLVKSFEHSIIPGKAIAFVEQFSEKLLVKQEGECLQIFDINTDSLIKIVGTEDFTPSAFIFLHHNRTFLTFDGRKVEVWDFNGKRVTSFEDHDLWQENCNTNNIYITKKQDILISYCKHVEDESEPGSINISDMFTGKALGKVHGDVDSDDEGKDQDWQQTEFGLRTKKQRALSQMSALYFNEDDQEIYTGNPDGTVTVWRN